MDILVLICHFLIPSVSPFQGPSCLARATHIRETLRHGRIQRERAAREDKDKEKKIVEMMSTMTVDLAWVRRKEGRKQKLTTFGAATSLFSRHMSEDVRFGGGGCRGVVCQV